MTASDKVYHVSMIDKSEFPMPSGPESETSAREKWANKWEFLLSCIGLSVGIGNVWRFPYLAYQNGGGAFILAYVVMLLLIGKPMFLMELAIGQFSGLNSFDVWRCFPLAMGVGAAMVMLCTLVSIYYNVIMTYTLYYMLQSFRSDVPWKQCEKWWGADEYCYVRTNTQINCLDVAQTLVNIYWQYSNGSYTTSNTTELDLVTVSWKERTAFVPYDVYNETTALCNKGTQTASEQFWEHYVLQLTDDINDVGTVKWDLALCLLACWIIVFLGLMKGIKSSGKVVYFTATFPYVILIILVVFGCTLPGALGGLRYLFIPQWDMLLSIGVWKAAAEQLLYSLSIGWGCLIMYSSYNDFENTIYRDAVFVSSLDFLTSLFAGIVIFSVLGNMAFEMNLDIATVAKGGQGLAFVAYPEALARLPIPQLWSVLFFFMLFLLAIDSQFSYLETIFSVIFDKFPNLKPRKTVIVFIICMVLYILGLPCVTQGGQYVLNLMDRSSGYGGLIVATAEVIVIMWCYGVKRVLNDAEFMMGFRLGIYWRICWTFITPALLLFVVIYGMTQHERISYAKVPYPLWAEILSWCLMLLCVIPIPGWAAFKLWKHRKNWKQLLSPDPLWGPSDVELRKIYRNKYFVNRQEEAPAGVINLGLDLVHNHIK